MGYTYDDVMNACDVNQAVYMAERPMPGHESQINAMLRHHWGVIMCSCCEDGFHYL